VTLHVIDDRTVSCSCKVVVSRVFCALLFSHVTYLVMHIGYRNVVYLGLM